MNKIKISNAFEFIRNGMSIKQSSDAGGIPITRIETISQGEIDFEKCGYADLTEENIDGKESYYLEEGDILMSHINSPKHLGKSALYNGLEKSIIHGMNLLCFRPDKSKLDSKFAQYYFRSSHFYSDVQKISNQSVNQASFAVSKVKNLKIPLPPLTTQKKIAAILDAADAHRQKTKQLLAKYDELAQSIFLDMFGDPVTNPKGWEVKNMKELTTKIMSGNTPKGGKEVYVDEGILFLRSQNVWRNNLVLDDVAFIDEKTHKRMTRSKLMNGDILMTKTGRFNTENSSLGRAAMFRGKDGSANVNGHVYFMRPKREVNREFILFILTTEQYRGLIRRLCVGGIDKRQLNKNHLEEFPIINPNREKQDKFTNVLDSIYKQKELLERELRYSENLFNSLLQKAFKGQLA